MNRLILLICISLSAQGLLGKDQTHHRPAVHSFDCFDTLVGRLHREPRSIFQYMEENLPYPGFMNLRIQGEKSAEKKTLDGIYSSIKKITGISNKKTKELRKFEFITELKNVFPIRRNLSRVRDGDIVVTDTYFTTREIQRILHTVGLRKKVKIFATYGGKYSGKIWKKIKKQYRILSHTGDNKHSDVASPKKHHIHTRWFTESSYSTIEKKLINHNLYELANLMRTLRLQNPYPFRSVSYRIWNEQAQLNVPILVLASEALYTFCTQNNCDRILFSERGCCNWIKIFRTLFPENQSISFATSRIMYYNPSSDYLDYVRSVYTPNTVIVDEFGTGNSVLTFFDTFFSQRPHLLYIFLGNNKNFCLAHAKTAHIEMLNQDSKGTLIGFTLEGPIRAKLEYDQSVIHPAMKCIDLCVSLLNKYRLKGQYNKKVMLILKSILDTHKPEIKDLFIPDHIKYLAKKDPKLSFS
jgi:hypothetical protein